MLSSALWISLNIGLSTGSHCQPATCTTEHHTNTTTAFISLFFRHTQTAYAKLTSYNLRIKSAKQVLDWHHGFGLSSKLASLLQMITVFHLLITASYHRWSTVHLWLPNPAALHWPSTHATRAKLDVFCIILILDQCFKMHMNLWNGVLVNNTISITTLINLRNF